MKSGGGNMSLPNYPAEVYGKINKPVNIFLDVCFNE